MEIWKTVTGFTKYRVSDHGNIIGPRKMLEPYRDKAGYYSVGLCKNTLKHNIYVHRIVAETFCVKPKSSERLEVNHIDGDKINNHASNLEWVTHKQNMQHAGKMGVMGCTRKCGKTKLTEMRVKAVWVLYNHGYFNQREIAEIFNVTQSAISQTIKKY